MAALCKEYVKYFHFKYWLTAVVTIYFHLYDILSWQYAFFVKLY